MTKMSFGEMKTRTERKKERKYVLSEQLCV